MGIVGFGAQFREPTQTQRIPLHTIFTGPINILAVDGTPPIAELEALGVARVSVGSGPMRATLALVRTMARELKATGTYETFTATAMPYTDVNELMK